MQQSTIEQGKHKEGCPCCHKEGCRCCPKPLSWTAIVAGAFVAIGLSFLLELFEVGIGLSAYSATETRAGASVLAFGGYIAMVIAGMFAMFIAGWVAGFIGRPRCTSGCHGILYGFLAWCLALILSFLLVTYAGEFLTYQFRGLTNSNVAEITMTSNLASPSLRATKAPEAQTGAGGATQVTVNTDEAAKELGKSVFLLFLLFLAGALSAAFGGYTAVRRCSKEDSDVNKAPNKM